MNIKQVVAQGSIAAVLAVGAIGAAPAAGADPDWDWHPRDEWVWNNWNGNDWNQRWRVNKWRNDDRPPWGWGGPPAVYWRGGIPHDLDYCVAIWV